MMDFSQGEIGSCGELFAAVHADGGNCGSELGAYSTLVGTTMNQVCCFTCYEETHAAEDPLSKECDTVEDQCREVLLMGASACDSSCNGLTKGAKDKLGLCQLCMQREFDNNPFGGGPLYSSCSCCMFPLVKEFDSEIASDVVSEIFLCPPPFTVMTV